MSGVDGQFAILGTLLSMIQLLVYALIAQQGGRAAAILWVALAAIVVGAQFTDSVIELLTLVTIVDAVVLLALLVPVILLAPKQSEAPDVGDDEVVPHS